MLLRPLIRPVSQPYWEALRRERIMLQHCRSCDHFVHYPRHFCPHCEGDDLDWRKVSGRGILVSFSRPNRPVSVDFVGLPLRTLAMVELEGEVRIATTLEADDRDPAVGDAVWPLFDHDGFEGITLLRFALKPIRAGDEPGAMG